MRLPEGPLDNLLLRGLMFYLVLPNLVFVLLGREFFINRALINSDYLLLWIASCYLSRRMAVLLYTGLLAVDLVLSTESIYHYSTVEIIVAAREMLEFDPAHFYLAAGMLLLAPVAALVVTRRRGAVRPQLPIWSQALIGIAGLMVTGATVARSIDPADVFDDAFGDGAIVASGVAEIGLSSFKLAMSAAMDPVTPASAAATSRLAREMSAQGKSGAIYDIVVILVESQGLLRNEGDMRRVFASLLEPAVSALYAVDRGAVRFHGATMSGELRTLCRVYMPHLAASKLPKLDRCLPNILRKLGYETVSFHGYDRWFYERPLWYPMVGFQRSYFAEDLQKLSPPRCGVIFPGVCDQWIAGQVEHELSAPGGTRKFIYWLTLNSHLPVDSSLASESGFDCAGTETLLEEDGPCELERIHFQLYARIAQMLLNKALPPTRFIIVGDHMPPFAALSERALYDDGRVPFVEFIPRGASRPVDP